MLDEAWSNIYGAFSHGYLVLVLCLWLAVRDWRAATPSHLAPAWSAAPVLLVLVIALVAMDILFLNSTRLAVLPLVFLASVALTFGWSAARALFWPSVFLYFALPQWWAINGVLQSFTSRIVSALVSLTGLPAYVEGNFIRVPAGMFEIASGCSGLNYLVAALSLAGFYALMYLRRWKSRAILLAAAALAAMLSNFVRIYALIMIGIASDMQHYLIRVEHLYFGWALFMAAMVPVLFLARKLDDADAAADSGAASASSGAGVPASVARSTLAAALLTALLLVLPEVIAVQTQSAGATVTNLPAQLGSWHLASGGAPSDWEPAFVNAQEQRAAYEQGSQRVDVYRASYPHQSRDAHVVRTENDFFGASWRLAEQHSASVGGSPVERVSESRGYLNERERLIWSWYVVAGKPAATKLGAKLAEMRGFFERRRDAAALAISTECVPDCAAARERLTRFMQESAASLQ